jgi:hypothetical protein
MRAPLEMRDAWEFVGGREPQLAWQGIQKIVLWILSVPLSVGLGLVGLALFFTGNNMAEEARRVIHARKRADDKPSNTW